MTKRFKEPTVNFDQSCISKFTSVRIATLRMQCMMGRIIILNVDDKRSIFPGDSRTKKPVQEDNERSLSGPEPEKPGL